MRFASFFMAGFECATGFNKHGDWIDQIAATQHERFADQDYASCAAAGLRTVREGVRWPLVDTGSAYDFRSVAPFVRAAERHGIQPIWDLFHYGYPEDLDIFGSEFVARFAEYCFAVGRYMYDRLPGPHLFTPVNEPSYFSWAAGSSALFAPHHNDKSWELKVQLARAAIVGIEALWAGCPGARIVNADPVCRQVCPPDRPDLHDEVRRFNEEIVFESLDMIAGRLLPELGGSERHLDVVGLNYYWTNQWEHGCPDPPLCEDDDRCWPLRDVVRWVYHRYGHDILITETAHSEPNKSWWMRQVADEAEAILDEGIPLRGICFYPILGMPEWHEPDTWTRMGLWDLHPDENGILHRRLHKPMFEALRDAQDRLEPVVLERPFTAGRRG